MQSIPDTKLDPIQRVVKLFLKLLEKQNIISALPQ